MPPVVLGAGIAAVGTLGAAALQSRASNKATEASTKANKEAVTYTKEQEAKAAADYERRLNDYYASRDVLLQRYGVSAPGLLRPAPAPVMPAGAVPRAATGVPGGVPATRPAGVPNSRMANIGEVLQAKQGGNDWNDWERYGLRQV